jgi:hypothetical protein
VEAVWTHRDGSSSHEYGKGSGDYGPNSTDKSNNAEAIINTIVKYMDGPTPRRGAEPGKNAQTKIHVS